MPEISLDPEYLARVERHRSALQSLFNEHWRAKTQKQRTSVENLKSLIGSIDWVSEGYAGPENQRDLSIKFHWGHDHVFDEDLNITGRMGDRHITLASEFISGFNISSEFFEGKSVLDVGSWTGGTTLTLKSLGAKKVLAIEEVRKYAQVAQTLANEVFNLSDVDVRPVSLFEFEGNGFDCVYYPGVIYHVSDPVLSLRILYNALNDGGEILVESAGLDSKNSICEFRGNRMYSASGSKENLDRGGWNWFIPSALCLSRWMIEAGFENVRTFRSPVPGGRVFGIGERRGAVEITRAGLSRRDIR